MTLTTMPGTTMIAVLGDSGGFLVCRQARAERIVQGIVRLLHTGLAIIAEKLSWFLHDR